MNVSVEKKVHFLIIQWGFILASALQLLFVRKCTKWHDCLFIPILFGVIPASLIVLILRKSGRCYPEEVCEPKKEIKKKIEALQKPKVIKTERVEYVEKPQAELDLDSMIEEDIKNLKEAEPECKLMDTTVEIYETLSKASPVPCDSPKKEHAMVEPAPKSKVEIVEPSTEYLNIEQIAEEEKLKIKKEPRVEKTPLEFTVEYFRENFLSTESPERTPDQDSKHIKELAEEEKEKIQEVPKSPWAVIKSSISRIFEAGTFTEKKETDEKFQPPVQKTEVEQMAEKESENMKNYSKCDLSNIKTSFEEQLEEAEEDTIDPIVKLKKFPQRGKSRRTSSSDDEFRKPQTGGRRSGSRTGKKTKSRSRSTVGRKTRSRTGSRAGRRTRRT